jgi:hypothetical protein
MSLNEGVFAKGKKTLNLDFGEKCINFVEQLLERPTTGRSFFLTT